MIELNFEPYIQLLAAVVLALPVAWDRERRTRNMGLRTFPLVAVGACGYVIVAQAFLGDSQPDASARVIEGLMTGIGFVGGGAILKGKDHVSGTASAASIWVTGAVGAAVGFKHWDYAIALSIINFSIIFLMSRVKPIVNGDNEHNKSDA